MVGKLQIFIGEWKVNWGGGGGVSFQVALFFTWHLVEVGRVVGGGKANTGCRLDYRIL